MFQQYCIVVEDIRTKQLYFYYASTWDEVMYLVKAFNGIGTIVIHNRIDGSVVS